MSDSDSSEKLDMVGLLKLNGFTKKSKLVWTLNGITFVGNGLVLCKYDIRIKNFADKDMRALWANYIDIYDDPVRAMIDWQKVNTEEENPGFSREVEISGTLTPIELDTEPLTERKIKIYTFGIRMRKQAPPDSEHTYFAGVLATKPHGVDLRK